MTCSVAATPGAAGLAPSWSGLDSERGTRDCGLLQWLASIVAYVQNENEMQALLAKVNATTTYSRVLTDYSRQLLEGIAALQRLEARKRRLAIGSPEFEEVAAEITRRARAIYQLAAEQQRAGASVADSMATIEDIDRASPSV